MKEVKIKNKEGVVVIRKVCQNHNYDSDYSNCQIAYYHKLNKCMLLQHHFLSEFLSSLDYDKKE